MKKLILSIVITISPILAQCNWNDDDQIDVLDVVSTVECILTYCWDGSQCDWNGDGDLNVIDVVSTANCYLNDCWEVDTVTDIDGNSYETVQIGDQLWMAENLKVTHYQNGEDIPTGFSGSEWGDLEYTETGAFAVYNDDPANIETFGNLYNWYAVDDSRGVCPEGYHMPSDEEWMELEMELGMSYEDAHDSGWRGTDQGSQLAGNADLWISGDLENDPVFDSSGFLALPGGYRYYSNGYYNDMGNSGYFWSSTASNISNAWYRILHYDESKVNRNYSSKHYGFSVRCLGDAE